MSGGGSSSSTIRKVSGIAGSDKEEYRYLFGLWCSDFVKELGKWTKSFLKAVAELILPTVIEITWPPPMCIHEPGDMGFQFQGLWLSKTSKVRLIEAECCCFP